MIVLLVQLQILLCHLIATTTAFYNFGMTSEEINDTRLRGFRDVQNKDFVLGGLFPVHSGSDCKTLRQQRGLERLEAMLFAIDRINNDTNLLPNLTIGYDVRDTCSEETTGLDEALDMIVRSGSLTVDVSMQCVQAGNGSTRMAGIVGAAASSVSTPIATLLGLNIFQSPLVSYASSSAALSNKNLYEYFLRTIPPDSFQANAMVDLISYFGWEYVSVIFNDNTYGEPGTDAFIDSAMRRGICIDYRRGIVQSEISGEKEFNRTINETVDDLLNSTANVVLAFTDEATIIALFRELDNRNVKHRFVWIASDAWANSNLVRDKFPEIARGTFGFEPHAQHVEEFADYFSLLTPSTNIRDPFFQEYYAAFCDTTNCTNGVTDSSSYTQGNIVPLIIDAVYVFAHAIQNFLDDNCDSPLSWDPAMQKCDGMMNDFNGENLLDYLFNVTFNGIQNRSVTFDKNGDPSGVYEIIHLQTNENGTGEYVSAGLWDSLNAEGALQLNNSIQFDEIKVISSKCSEPCAEGYIRSITSPTCPSCFECIPCVGPTYSMNSNGTNCSLCSDNHWGNNPLSGSTHCVPVEVRHIDFSNGWSITSMCIASITLIILAVITVIFVMTWKTPVVKSSGREQMIMLLIGIGSCCVLTYIIVAPPSTGVCVFQRIGVWLCFSLIFGALFVKIVRVARIFYSIKSSTKRPRFINPIHQVIFTMVIVAGQLLLVVIGLGVDPPVVERDPEVVTTSYGQAGNAPEIVETCQQPHAALLILLLIYNAFIIVGCTILGLMTRRFPQNFNEARHVMFTSFTLIVVWVLFAPLLLYTEDEFQTGVLALGIVLTGIAVMAGVFFPRVFIIVFQKERNTKEYASQKNHMHTAAICTSPSATFSTAFQRSKSLT